jgi:hypothetical protein
MLFLCLGLLAIAILALMPAADRAESISGDNVIVDFRGSIRPRALPRAEAAPVSLHVQGAVHPIGEGSPSALAEFTVQVNRHAVFTTRGLPRCPLRKLHGTSTHEALANCGEALLGSGYFTSHIDIPEQAPFPAWGRVLAFNTRKHGHQAVAIHVFGHHPAPTSTVLAAALLRSNPASGAYGPELRVEMPRIGDEWGYVSSFSLTLHRRYRYRGKERSVISASCPAPPDLSEVPFKAARGTFELADGQIFTRTLGGTCRAIAMPQPPAHARRPSDGG